MHGQRDLLAGSDEDWLATFDDVLLATVRACRAAVPVLIEGGGGSIVTTAAYSIRAPKAHQFPYATLKAGVATLTKNVAKSFGHLGVRANCVCPGATETEILATLRASVAESRRWPYDEALERVMTEEWGMQVALGRPGRPRNSATSLHSCFPSAPATSPAPPSTSTAAPTSDAGAGQASGSGTSKYSSRSSKAFLVPCSARVLTKLNSPSSKRRLVP